MQNVQVVKKHKVFSRKRDAMNNGFIHIVSIPWEVNTSPTWGELCADVIEVFGLPGNRFVTHATFDNMDFYFKSNKDATLCKILLSEKLLDKVALDLNKNV